MLFMLAYTFFSIVVLAKPQIALPLNSQVPPVARALEHFSFQFSPSTFVSDEEIVEYTLSYNSSWLSLDGPSRTLSGTPQPADVGPVMISITAADSTGDAIMECTLIVSSAQAPQLKPDLTERFADFGNLAGPRRVILSPSEPFELDFSNEAVVKDGKNITYYATLSDRTPLPSWIDFDGTKPAFMGSALTIEVYPQEFELLLITSDVPGFAGATLPFTLVVSDHELAFFPQKESIHVIEGSKIEIDGFRDSLKLDGERINDADLHITSAELPSDLSFDNDTFAITGNLALDSERANGSVTATDRHGNVAVMTLEFVVEPRVFLEDIGPLFAVIGQNFSHNIEGALSGSIQPDLSLNMNSSTTWFQFDQEKLEIHGMVPPDVEPQIVAATLMAKAPAMVDPVSHDFEIHVSLPVKDGHSEVSAETSQPAHPGHGTARLDSTDGQWTSRQTTIVATVLSCVAFVAAFCGACFFCKRRRRRLRRRKAARLKHNISRPVVPVDNVEHYDQDEEQVVNQSPVKSEREHYQAPQLFVHPPKQRDTGSRSRLSMASSVDQSESVLAEFDRSYASPTTKEHVPHESMKIPTEMARRSRHRSFSLPKHSEHSSDMYESEQHIVLPGDSITTRSEDDFPPTLPRTWSKRSTSEKSARNRSSHDSLEMFESNHVGSPTPSAFPVPPTRPHASTHLSVPCTDNRKSIRLVSRTSTISSLTDRRSISEKRQSYIRNRASSHSPFFAGGSSRNSSQSHRTPVLGPQDPTEGAAAPSEPEIREFPGSLRRKSTKRSTVTPYSASRGPETPLRVQKREDRRSHSRLAETLLHSLPRSESRSDIHSGRVSERLEKSNRLSDYWLSSDSSYSEDHDSRQASFALSMPVTAPAPLLHRPHPLNLAKQTKNRESRDRPYYFHHGRREDKDGARAPTSKDASVTAHLDATRAEHKGSELGLGLGLGLNLSPLRPEEHEIGSRTPLSSISNESHRPRLVQGKGKRPVSVESVVGEGGWGSLRGVRGNEAFL